jgi:hypothetical protein
MRLPCALAGVLLVGLEMACAPSVQTSPNEPRGVVRDWGNVSLTELNREPVSVHKDPKTGFVVGGQNATASIKALDEINGRRIANLEADMRPDPEGFAGVTSIKGFLGPTEKLLDVMAADNKYVVDESGLTHQELAKHLLVVVGITDKCQAEFVYHGRRYKVQRVAFGGWQLSPFKDDTRTDQEATVQNLENGKKLHYSLLVPLMIERYGFYEGKGTPYRVEPREVVEVFDFLVQKIGKQ